MFPRFANQPSANRKVASFALLCILFAAPAASARTWIVGGAGADFTEIDDAIAAASDGDVVLVRPGTYRGFVLSKGVIVSGSTNRFVVSSDVTVSGIAAGLRAGVARVRLPDTAVLEVSASAGEIVLDDVLVDRRFDLTEPRVRITDADNVSVTDIDVSAGRTKVPQASVVIRRSSVRMTTVIVYGASGYSADGDFGEPATAGSPAMDVTDSDVVLARPVLIGGGGGSGETLFCGVPNGASGGTGLLATDSRVVILGTADHVVAGGNGGDANLGCGFGGDGGAGMFAVNSNVLISMVRFEGGRGGEGWGTGQDGRDSIGGHSRDDGIPQLRLAGPIQPGEFVSVFIKAWRPSNVLVLISDRGGFADAGSFVGPDLSVLPGTFLLTAFLRTDAVGFVGLHGRLPDEPALQGMPIHMQAVAANDSGGHYLSNASARIVGE